MIEATRLKDRIYATIIGGAIGDSLGVPVEFEARDTFKVTDMLSCKAFNRPAGTWSDDTSLTLCLVETLIEGGDLDALMGKFSDWNSKGYMTPHGQCFDEGVITNNAIKAFREGTPANQCGQSGEYDNGNGSLMRIAPVAFLNIEDKNFNGRLARVEKYSSITHAHLRSILGCFIYTEYLRQLYLGKQKVEALDTVIEIFEMCSRDFQKYQAELFHYERILNGKIMNLSRDEIKSGGYVVHTLEAALWCFLKNDDYQSSVLEAVNLGHDADTTGLVAGSMAGMYYGQDGIPSKWVNLLSKIETIKELCTGFADGLAATQ